MVAFGEILINVGDVGLFQKLILLGLQNLIFPVLFTSFLFVQTDSGRHCNTDWILRAGANLSSEEQLNLTMPREQHGAFSRWLIFNPVDWDINTIRENGFRPLSARRDGSTTRHYETTIVTSFGVWERSFSWSYTNYVHGWYCFWFPLFWTHCWIVRS